jgi:hypothetical protein
MPVERNRNDQGEEKIPPPTGTIVVMSLYLLLLSLVWAAMYLLLIEK